MRALLPFVFLLAASSNALAEWRVIENFSAVQARQESDTWCFAAALQMVARAQRVELAQEQIVRMTRNASPGATYEEMTRFVLSGWHGPVGDPNSWTIGSDTFPGAPPDVMMARFFDIGRPIILAYRTPGKMAHAVVAFGGDWVVPRFGVAALKNDDDDDDDDEDTGPSRPAEPRFRTIRVFDPLTNETTNENWAEFGPTIMGAWIPIVVKRDDCNTFGPNIVHAQNCNRPVGRGGVF